MRLITFALVSALLFGICPAAYPEDLSVSAAVSLGTVLAKLVRSFESQHSGVRVYLNLSSSGSLARQIERGAPADVFIAAGVTPVEQLRRRRLVDPGRIFAANRLVAVVPKGKACPGTLHELTARATIVIPNPLSVPAGQYAVRAFEHAGIYDRLCTLKKLVYAESIYQALSYIENGCADAGVIYVTDARASKRVCVCFMLDESSTGPIRYAAATTVAAHNKGLAAKFVDLLLSDEGQKTLQAAGFIPVHSGRKP